MRLTKEKLQSSTEADGRAVKPKREKDQREATGTGCHLLSLLWMTGVLHYSVVEGKPHIHAACAFIYWTLNEFHIGPKVMEPIPAH